MNAPPMGRKALVVEVARVSLPDDLDTEDIQVRHGSVLQGSRHGRWASRLSVGATGLLTARLARRRPDALFTDQPQAGAPSYRILVNVSRLDVTAEGAATLEADWQIVPRDPARPARRDRTRLVAMGPVATDRDVVALVGTVLDQLAENRRCGPAVNPYYASCLRMTITVRTPRVRSSARPPLITVGRGQVRRVGPPGRRLRQPARSI